MSISIINVPVPSSGDGPITSIANLTGEKTVELSGYFDGRYILLGSQDDIHFVPVLSFDTSGKENIKLSLPLAMKSVRARAMVASSSGVTLHVSGLFNSGVNNFATIASFAPGSSGEQPTVDLISLFPPVGLESDIAFLCSGEFDGLLTIDGSLDGINFNPLGGFRSGSKATSLTGSSPDMEFSPLVSESLIRYVRTTVSGFISRRTTVTIGGSSLSAGGGGSGTQGLQGPQGPQGTQAQSLGMQYLYSGSQGFVVPEFFQALTGTTIELEDGDALIDGLLIDVG